MTRPTKASPANISEAIATVKANHPIKGYTEELEDEIRTICELLLKIEPPPGALLDIGCGGLEKTATFQALGYQCFACDDFQDPWHKRDGNVDRLMAFARNMSIRVHKQDASHSIPWPNDFFDVVTLIAIIEHLHESPRKLLNVAGSHLKTGGTLAIVVPNSANLRKRISVALGRTNYPSVRAFYDNIGIWRGHVREYTLMETVQILEWSGYHVALAETFHGMLRRRLQLRLARQVYKALCEVVPTLRDSIFVAAHKPPDWKPKPSNPDAARASARGTVPQAVA